MTEDERFLKKAEEELVAVSWFSDWNPSHFLDVAEMTMGVAIGYDWLYADLSEHSREVIKSAILMKGINPSKNSSYTWWLTSSNNWNQVCNAGMVYGALAIQEDYPDPAEEIIDRAFESIPKPMLTPTGRSFNWSDCGTGTNLNTAMLWIAQRSNDPSVLWSEKRFLELGDYSKFKGIRSLPALMIWAKDIPLSKIEEPKEKFWMGQGKNPVCLMRSSWTDPDAIYLGFKAGSPSVNHGHMDIGSFMMEADGIRWVSDFGSQNYESLESKGMSIFGRSQDAERWTIFRLNNYAHSTLTINDELQKVEGYAKIDKYSENDDFMFATSDISSLYNGQLIKAFRGCGIKDGKYIVVRDEVETPDNPAKVRWNLVTPAKVELGKKAAILTKDGETLFLKILGPDNIMMKTWSTAPANDYDAETPETIMVGFECELPADTKETFEVLLVPGKSKEDADFLNLTLNEW